jgi:phosphoglycerate dehydrogenase-like enzyme
MPWPHLAAVAEHIFMFMLALSHKLLRGHKETVEGAYVKTGLTPMETTETKVAGNWTEIPDITFLYGKLLGIVGMGEIGRFLVKQGHGFNMQISYFKRHRLPESEEQALGIEYRDLDHLLNGSDYVAPVVPHTPETKKMFGERQFSLMKPSAFFINCCRGGIVDQGALCRALKNGAIAGAGLDVYEKEPIPIDDPLLKLDNVVFTPHSAGTREEVAIGCKMVCENILRAERGETAQNLLRF